MESVIHSRWADWAEQLRARALQPVPALDEPVLLDRFRRHSDWYRERIGAARRLVEVPPLEKADIAGIPVAPAGDLADSRSSGTTGFQVTIRNNWREREFRRALLYRPQLFYDLPGSVRQVVFVDGRDCASQDTPPKRFVFGGREYTSWFVGAAADPAAILDLLNAIRPELIRGISSAIVRFIDQAPGPLRRIRPRYVGPGGESLRADWRTRIEKAFGTTVLDRYGSTETGALAWQCPYCRHYHANSDEIVIEADPGGLIATPLFVDSQPLLRYRLGDQVSLSPPVDDCRIRLPVLQIRQARRDDWIIDGAGRAISPLSFQFEQLPGLKAWRLHQRADGGIDCYFDAIDAAVTGPALATALGSAIPGRAVQLIEGQWRLDRPGKFKRVSSAFARPAAADA